MSSVLERIRAQKAAAEAVATEKQAVEAAARDTSSSREALAARVRDALSLSREHLSGLLSGQLEERKTLSGHNKEGITTKLSETEALYRETEAAGVELSDTDKQGGRLETIKGASDPATIEALKVKRDEIKASKQLEKTHSYLQENLSNLSTEEMTTLNTAIESGDTAAISAVERTVRDRIKDEAAIKAEKDAAERVEADKKRKEKEAADLEEKIKNFPETKQKLLSDILEFTKIYKNETYKTEMKFELFQSLSDTYSEEIRKDGSELRAVREEVYDLYDTQADLIKKICNEIGRPDSFNKLMHHTQFIIGDILTEKKMILYPEWAEEIKNEKIQLELARLPGLTEEHIRQIEDVRDKIAFLDSKMTEIVFNKMIESNPQNKEKIFKIVDRENKIVAEMKRLNGAVRENDRITKILNERDGGSRPIMGIPYNLENTFYPIRYDSGYGRPASIQTLRYNNFGSFVYR